MFTRGSEFGKSSFRKTEHFDVTEQIKQQIGLS
jgi:hypothetical protein